MDVLNYLLAFGGSVIRTSTPILFVALGILITQSSGVVNMGAEGMMLIGCLTGVVGTAYTGSVWFGVILSMVIVGLVGLIFGYIAIEFRVNQIVLGIGFNMLGVGLTTTLYRGLFGFNANGVTESFEKDMFGMTAPVYIVFLLVIILQIFLFKTKLGLKIRAVGEYPKAVETVGLSVKKLRYLSCFLGSALIGFGGAYLSTGQLNMFIEEMTNGRGYIALAAVTFGKYKPRGTMLAVLLFGAGEAIQYRLQAGNSDIPYQFVLMIPYILTVVALALFIKNATDPEALGVPYEKSK